MARAPDNLAFFKGTFEEEGYLLPGWSDLPSRRTKGRNTFFNTPLIASARAIETYGKTVLLQCLAFLQERANELNGIDSFQEFCDMTREKPSLIFIEESNSGDNGTVVVLDDDTPLRVIVMLGFEIHTYCLKYGSEWVGMRNVER